MKNKPTLAITPGDPRGIGVEVTQKAIRALQKELKGVYLVIFSKKFKTPSTLDVEFIEPPTKGKSGCGWAIETATKFVLENPKSRALVTGPIHKVTLRSEGYPFNGHTDMLASLTRSSDVTMVLANEWFRVALVTNHCPLNLVSKKISSDLIAAIIDQVSDFTRSKLDSVLDFPLPTV